MADPKVDRIDREGALRMRYGADEPHELYVEWAETGVSRMDYPTSSFSDVIARMEILAKAHALGRACADERLRLLSGLADARAQGVLELSAEVVDLKARLADAEGEGCTLHKHAPHGKEAQELRRGIEKLLESTEPAWRTALQMLLDRIDARDSLAHLRANELLREHKAALRRGRKSHERAMVIMLDALVDGLESGRCSTKAVRTACVALGAKRKDLPQDIPPWGRRRR